MPRSTSKNVKRKIRKMVTCKKNAPVETGDLKVTNGQIKIRTRKGSWAAPKYAVEHNGDTPFFIDVETQLSDTLKPLIIYKMSECREEGADTMNYSAIHRAFKKVALKIPKYTKIFIGANDGPYKNQYEQRYKGSSILIQVDPHKYIYVNRQIVQFTTTDVITKFHSIMGNNMVPYPYAVGDKNTYLLMDNVYIPNELRTKEDPYLQYYTVHPGGKITYSPDAKKYRSKILVPELPFVM